MTVPSLNGRRRRDGIRIHRSGRLGATEVTVHESIPVTTLARTLLDLVDILSPQALKRTVDEAEYLRRLDMTALVAVVEGNPGRRGAKLLAAARGPQELTRSGLEDEFLCLVERRGIPRPRVGVRIEGYEVDFFWPEANLVVELDGFAAHRTRSRFEGDRVRDRRLAGRGIQTIRLTANAVRYDEDAIADELRALLRRLRASPNPPRRSSSSSASAR